jgi:hypothetical protein
MKGETCALFGFCRNVIILMVRRGFKRPGFCLNPSDLLVTVTVAPSAVLERVDVPELLFDDVFLHPGRLHSEQLQQSERRRRQRIPEPTEFVINVIASGTRQLGNFIIVKIHGRV